MKSLNKDRKRCLGCSSHLSHPVLFLILCLNHLHCVKAGSFGHCTFHEGKQTICYVGLNVLIQEHVAQCMRCGRKLNELKFGTP